MLADEQGRVGTGDRERDRVAVPRLFGRLGVKSGQRQQGLEMCQRLSA